MLGVWDSPGMKNIEHDLKNIFSNLDGTGSDWTEIFSNLDGNGSDWAKSFSNLDGTGADWTEIIDQHINSIQNQNNQQYGASQYNSPGIIAGAVLTLLSFLIGPILCACKFSKRKKEEEPIDPQANFVPMNHVEHTSEQPHHPGHGRPTPYSVNQSWNTRCTQPGSTV